MKKGIDISYHQGTIDFVKVKQSGIEFVIIREGYRNQTDEKFFEYVKAARAAGLKILGCYHFSYALTERQAREEAFLMCLNMSVAGLDNDIVCFFDAEYDTIRKASKQNVNLGHEQINRHANVFCEEIRRTGRVPGIYTNYHWLSSMYYGETIRLGELWLADYNKIPPTRECLVQQYSDKGAVPGISVPVDLDYYYGDFKMEEKPMRSRAKVVSLVNSWVGKKESDGSHKSIVDIYNSYSPLPRGIKMSYSWAWCACTWSALAIALGYTDIMPIEISCGLLIDEAKKMRCWIENDGYCPKPADGILYDWDDNGIGDNTGWPDHVGIVTEVYPEAGYMVVTEGNCADMVKKRTVSINGRFIRGFITPKYTDDGPAYENPLSPGLDVKTVAHEVIAGKWGNGDERKNNLKMNGYDPAEVQKEVNRILNGQADKPNHTTDVDAGVDATVKTTCYARNSSDKYVGTWKATADVYCRNDAGTNKKALCVIPKGSKVKCYGNYSSFNGTDWLLVLAYTNSTRYEGFISSKYLEKVN